MTIALWIAGVALALFAADRFGVWAERKGWIYWRKRGTSSAMSGILSDLNAMTNPAAEYVKQAKEAKKMEERDNGDPPSVVG
jgi:hypothetical protein